MPDSARPCRLPRTAGLSAGPSPGPAQPHLAAASGTRGARRQESGEGAGLRAHDGGARLSASKAAGPCLLPLPEPRLHFHCALHKLPKLEAAHCEVSLPLPPPANAHPAAARARLTAPPGRLAGKRVRSLTWDPRPGWEPRNCGCGCGSDAKRPAQGAGRGREAAGPAREASAPGVGVGLACRPLGLFPAPDPQRRWRPCRTQRL